MPRRHPPQGHVVMRYHCPLKEQRRHRIFEKCFDVAATSPYAQVHFTLPCSLPACVHAVLPCRASPGRCACSLASTYVVRCAAFAGAASPRAVPRLCDTCSRCSAGCSWATTMAHASRLEVGGSTAARGRGCLQPCLARGLQSVGPQPLIGTHAVPRRSQAASQYHPISCSGQQGRCAARPAGWLGAAVLPAAAGKRPCLVWC